MEKKPISAIRKARTLALQALYQWLMTNHELYEIETQFRLNNNMEKVDGEYFCKLLYGIPKELDSIETSLAPYLDRELKELNPVELSALRLGAYELLYCPELPYKIALDEAVSLAKKFGSQDGHRYVNGVLNNLARQVRAYEVQLDNK
ncbi:MAG: transcription antitermination factor NusB [Proteobacteria bacterium]|nr:transcription antitermination factor NusB [Pseudomonadota bacterium]